MTMLSEIPQEFFDGVPLPSAVTLDGELLGALDETPAGPWLAEMVGAVDCTRLTTFELPAYLRACQRVASWANAQLAAAVVELAGRPDGLGVDKDIAFALREPVGGVHQRLWWSKRLVRLLPGTWQRLAAGEICERHAKRMVEVTATVDDPELLAQLEERVLPRAGTKTVDQLVRTVRKTLGRLDPDGSQRRAKAARDFADVALYEAEDGMGDVTIHTPIEDAVTIKTAVDAYAAAAKSAGDDRPIGVLRAEAPVRWASEYLTGNSGSGGRAPRAAGRPIEIGITLGLRTALGLDQLPGELPGFGIVPRDVIAAMIRTELPKLRLMVIDEHDGRLLYRAEHTYRPTANQVAQVRATYVFSAGPGSKVLATRCDTDHAIAHPVGPTQIGNLIPLDRAWHVGKTKGEIKVRVGEGGQVYVTSPSGQTRTTTPHDYRMTDEAEADPSDQ